MALSTGLVERIHARANAGRWRVDPATFAQALERSVDKAFAGAAPDQRTVEEYLAGLHLADLALACACAAGSDEAWQHFVSTYRPALYRAADAIDPTGGSRELADSLYAELFGLSGRTGEQQSLFRYFHGRSSLATWLRAVLSQRLVDRVRQVRKTAPIPDDDSPESLRARVDAPDPERDRFAGAMRMALAHALGSLAPTDRLRMACYYAQQMTLAQIGRLLGEHEATVSRHLARTRAATRASVEGHLRSEHGLEDIEIAECFRSLAADAGPLDLSALFAVPADEAVPREPGVRRKLAVSDRSRGEGS
jgi:RNA polymerase sigma-70 factor, ECF subfamily